MAENQYRLNWYLDELPAIGPKYQELGKPGSVLDEKERGFMVAKLDDQGETHIFNHFDIKVGLRK